MLAFLKLLKQRLVRSQPRQLPQHRSPASKTLSSKDIKMVSGGDVITTQLDLARAYMEMGKHNLAKSILYHVKKNGTSVQQQEASNLIDSL